MLKSKKSNFVFFGAPNFSVTVLDELKTNNILPSLIVSSPDRPRGRGNNISPSPVKAWALENNIKVLTPEDLNETAFLNTLKKGGWEYFVIAAYGKILSDNILHIPPLGVINVHPSLLPLYRGPSPIQGALLSGDKETGVTLMLTDEKMDHGPIISQKKITINESDNSITLSAALAKLAGNMLAQIIPNWASGNITTAEQDHKKATYTKLLKKSDGRINWNLDAEDIINMIKAFRLWPTAWTTLDTGNQKLESGNKETDGRYDNPDTGNSTLDSRSWKLDDWKATGQGRTKQGIIRQTKNKRVKILQARIADKKECLDLSQYKPGEIIKKSGNLLVAARNGFVIIQKLQVESKSEIDGSNFNVKASQFLSYT